MVIEIIINGFLLHRIYGRSVHMVGAVWSSLTQCLIQVNGGSSRPAPTRLYKVQGDVELRQVEVQAQFLPSTSPKATRNDASSSKEESEEIQKGFFSYKT